MRDRKLDRLFDRFRRRGDVDALGEVFDATAPELLRVAASLVRDPNEADDLLQATFLTAIERCERYESERRLVPWLLGILVNHAREERRERVRPLEVARLAPSKPVTPEAHAFALELGHELERALAELSSEDRSLLDDYLRADKSPAEIARERGLAPGAARMRIHRGLDRLRRALPAGIALGAAASAQGLSAVRAAVLRAGTTAAKNLAPSAGSALGGGAGGLAGGLIGGLMAKKLILAGVAVALAAGVWFLVRSSELELAGGRGEVVRAETAELPAVDGARKLVRPAGATTAALVDGSSVPSARQALSSSDPDHAGLRGRVVEHDGQPVANLSVALLEVEETQLFPVLSAAGDGAAAPRFISANTTTGADGVFELHGAVPLALHALGVDLGGARATVRMLDAKLTPGAATDLGDVVLSVTGVLSGSVVDPAGRPVAGARVRVGPIPPLGVALGLQNVGPGGAITELPGMADPKFVFELPDWTAALVEKLPLATTTTDASGAFTLTLAAGSGLTALVDAPGFARLASASFDLAEGGRHELGPLALSAGQRAQGRVRGADGRPIPDAELRAGTLSAMGSVAVLGPPQRSDAEGRFVFEHLPDGFNAAVIGRPGPAAPWTCAQKDNGEFTLEFETGRELAADVLDASGAPIPAPHFFARPGPDLDLLGAFAPELQPLAARADETRPGRWWLGPLSRGSYLVAVRAAEWAQATARVEITADELPALALRLVPVRRVGLLVRDPATGEPVSAASVRVEDKLAGGGDSSDEPTTPLVLTRTDDQGHAQLEVPDKAEPTFWLYVEHPRFAPSDRPLDAGDSQVVELSKGATLVARITDPGLTHQRCMLQLWQQGGAHHAEFPLPRIAGLSSDEPLELERLAVGEWSWSLFESLAGEDLIHFANPEGSPRSLASGEFVLAEGQTFELLVAGDRGPARPSDSGLVLSGVVRVEGRLAGALDVNLCPLEENQGETLYVEGSDGRFRFDDVPPGYYTLIVSTQALFENEGRELVRERHLFSGTEEVRLEFDLQNLQAHVRVLTVEGAPAEGAKLRVIALEHDSDEASDVSTDRDGHARLELARPGRYAVVAVHPDEGLVRGELEVSAGGPNELTLTLARGVECAGTLQLAPDATFDSSAGTLLVHPEESDLLQLKCPVELEQGRASFRFVGLPPGKYRALLWGEESMLQSSFELPERGNGALELRFRRLGR